MSTTEKRSRPFTLYLLTVCLLFLAVNALTGGVVLLYDVTGGAMQLPLSWLDGTPFPNYLIPGLFLFTVFGVGSLVVVYALWARPHAIWLTKLTWWTGEHWAWAAAFALGVVLVAWIIIQMLVIRRYHPLQLGISILGVIIVALDMLPGVRRYYQ